MIYLIVIFLIWIAFIFTAIWFHLTKAPEERPEDVRGEVRQVVFTKGKCPVYHNLN